MTSVQFNDGETRRQQRNLTGIQKKNNNKTKEGVIVNSFVKGDDNEYSAGLHHNLDDTKDTLIISNEVKLPSKIYENNTTPEKSLLPISIISVGIMGIFAGISAFIKRNAKITNEIAEKKWITSFTRNISINEETIQAIVQMVQNPNVKTVRAGVGVLTLTAMGFMGKTFIDGFKDVWVKKKEADIQKNLQEQLIAVETQSFSGKMQIVRNMLSEKTNLFSKYLGDSKPNSQPFGMFKNPSRFYFGNNTRKNSDKNNSIRYFLLGAGTIASIVGLAMISLKNLQAGSKETTKFVAKTKADMEVIAKSGKDKSFIKNYLENMSQFISIDRDSLKTIVSKTNWSEKEKISFVDEIINKIETSTVKVNPNIGGDGTQKPSFSSFVNDYRAFFYNMLIEPDNKQFQQLFYGTTALTAVSYGGKVLSDAIKEVQVKKINAQTEFNLQQRLVSTELRNFKAKKDAAVKPLVNEFFNQVDSGKSKEQLKTIAENILFEIKNGPPFVYS